MANGNNRPRPARASAGAGVYPDWRHPGSMIGLPKGEREKALRQDTMASPGSMKRGGKVKRTGPAKLHKGERVLTAKQAKKATPAKLRAAARKPAPRTRRR